MKPLIYKSTEPTGGADDFVGRFKIEGKFQPIVFSGPDEETLRTKMLTWWDEQVAKYSKPDGRKAPRRKMEQAPS